MKAKQLIFFIVISFTVVCCEKDKSTLSTVKTYTPKYYSSSSVTAGCIIESDGGAGIADCGVYFSISQDAETTGQRFKLGNDTGLFLARVTGLLPDKQYYIKAYAVNTKGEALGEEVSFTTPGTVTDYDANVYGTVKIGNQIWMAENLKTTHFLNGDAVNTTDPATLEISNDAINRYQWTYNGDDANRLVYGKLYTWDAITDNRKVCPAGWHVPSDAEWTTLETSLGGYQVAGSSLKEAGNDHWKSPYNLDATNESCFSCLPGGYRPNTGGFYLIKETSYFWSSTESEISRSWSREITNGGPLVGRISTYRSWGLSVRCVKD